MMRQYELVERVTSYDPDADEALLNRAYVYAMRAHGSQKRASGDPYFSHPLEVAAILTELKLDDATIASALLHDTIEDTDTTKAEIERLFGPEIAELVDGLTKIKRLDLVSKKAEQAENLRKFMLAISRDVRVLLVKLADRLHNMRTLEYMPEDKRRRIAEETMDIYAPLAGRMGIQWMRDELEELAFRQLNRQAYDMISARLAMMREANRELIAEIEAELKAKLAANDIAASVFGREKRAYSIWRKMERKSVSFEQLSDIIGFRIIVDSVEDCYRALGIVHTTWRMVPGRYKDYISTPKQNDYRSIHTTVIGPRHRRVELQIRTREMHDVAEYGIAAHALYKDGTPAATGEGRHQVESGAYRWLRRLIEMVSEGNTPEEFLEHTKLELFQDQVFCFTPKGRLIALPRGANAIDFAYAVHTDVGNTAIGCKINGRLEPLISELHNGDEVEIITSKAQSPSPAWETIAVTGKARSAIRRATREASRRQYAGLGRQIVQRAFARADKPYSDERLAGILGRLAQPSVEDALAAVGRGELSSLDILKSMYPDYQEQRLQRMSRARKEDGWFGLKRAIGLKFRAPDGRARKNAIPIRGIKGDLPVKFAENGGAVPGDRIVGILTPGEGITIYPIHSPDLKTFDDYPERWLDVRWDIDEENPERFPTQIQVRAINEPGTLARITQAIAESDGNIDNIKMIRRSPDFHEMIIDLEVWDLKHLTSIISVLKNVDAVNSVSRVNG
ncbi:GTP pyrophosphokinase/guanosine-3',5'-bis(diphosphate) 3'-pyrophosphohydrolase [Tepidamorphus gemmatus]|uniref:GTP pyrophosphokinase rsh n=1 Tax=Tepidamorphus gemmatus TaxID=747076 RepID=A0A4R3MCS1_9HYPH|nr:bifunctional (p)ppGpp synthetase/guanosine-3',5'-bis(diphosphate) 3'-pyrophosphohydrolase [Tepidamorphus gemmatus]TCT11514.1 GTP pyrophosphokinase/guanosine-3',5'-bis(diphosphate) 3'-pyrophosphohydrolase [Tepidamorphus gemmatus]